MRLAAIPVSANMPFGLPLIRLMLLPFHGGSSCHWNVALRTESHFSAVAGLATIETQSGRYAATRPFSR